MCVSRWIKRSLIGTWFLQILQNLEKDCSRLCPGIRRKKRHIQKPSGLRQSPFILPSSWCVSSSSHLFFSFPIYRYHNNSYSHPLPWQGAPRPSLVTLLGFNFGICASPALPTRAPWIPWQPTLRKRYTMATTTATNTTQQELKLTHSLLSWACRTTGISCTAGLFPGLWVMTRRLQGTGQGCWARWGQMWGSIW